MVPREASPEPALRCDHCGRAVRETSHTRNSYRVDYYTVHSGHGELCTVAPDDRQQAFTYVRLFDRFDVVSCADCYPQPTVQAERDRQFQPERGCDSLAHEEA